MRWRYKCYTNDHIYCLVLRTTEKCTSRWPKRYFSYVFDLNTGVQRQEQYRTICWKSASWLKLVQPWGTHPSVHLQIRLALKGRCWAVVDMSTFIHCQRWRERQLWNLLPNFKISACSWLLGRVQPARYCAESARIPDSSRIVCIKYHPEHRTAV